MSNREHLAYLIGAVRKMPALNPDEFDDEHGHGWDALERWRDRDTRARERDDARRYHKSVYDTWH